MGDLRVNRVTFTVNGLMQNVPTQALPIHATLNDYLRDYINLTGTKFMCEVGGCGACVVSATMKVPKTNEKKTYAVNSCLVNLLSCQGWEITTVEGLGNRITGLHELQQKMVDFNASQCGFCAPGMVMSMFALNESNELTPEMVEHSMGGNICRCTGYRSLLDAFKSMSQKQEGEDIEDVPHCLDKCYGSCNTLGFCEEFNSDRTGNVSNYKGGEEKRLNNDPQLWYRATEIRDIFRIFNANKRRKNYAFVAGNTARGLYDDYLDADYYIDISSVAELHGYILSTKNLVIGANTTITQAIQLFYSIAKHDDGFKHLEKLADHLKLIASVAINNLATIAGNLAVKHAHPEFPSDVFLLLEAAKAQIVIDNGKIIRRFSPCSFLSYDMNEKIIRQIEIPPLLPTIKFGSYKIMKRSQNSLALVNAAFMLDINDKQVIKDANIIYGGINSTFVHASKLERFLEGKILFDNFNMQGAFKVLSGEVQPEIISVSSGIDFRRKLAVSLFYKFILSIAPEAKIQDVNKSGRIMLQRPLSTGSTQFTQNTDMSPIGNPIGKLDVADIVSGTVKYINDLPNLPGQLYAAFVQSNATPGSILKKINPEKALALEGVAEFMQATDISEIGGINTIGSAMGEEEVLFLPLGGSVKFYAQPVGIIIARTRKIAKNAVDLVELSFEHSTTVPLMSIQDVLKHDAKDRIHHEGTLLAAHQDTADVLIKGQQFFGWQYHHFMEMNVSFVIPTDFNGVIVHPSTQFPLYVQEAVARCLNLQSNQVTVEQHRIGGGFGGKSLRHSASVAAALAAYKMQKPVKFIISMEAQMEIFGRRCAVYSDYDCGVNENGQIQYLNNIYYADNGAYGNALYSSYMLDVYMKSYVSDGFQIETNWVKTDNPGADSMRAPGSLDGAAMIESIMERIAAKLNKDPLEVKLANLNGEKYPLLKRMVDECAKWSAYNSRRRIIDEFNKTNRWRKKGISIIPLTYGLYYERPMHVQVTVYNLDATVEIKHGGMDIGQGINTKLTQVAAYLLGVDMDKIRVKSGDTFMLPNNAWTGGSVTTDGAIKALSNACKTLKSRLDDATKAENLPDTSTWVEKIVNANKMGVNLNVSATYADDPNNSGNYDIHLVGVSEIELDLLTGQHVITRVDILADCGNSLNPTIDIGQIEGAFVMGMGHWMMEDMISDVETGQLLTNNTWEYKVPSAKDIPIDFRIRLMEGVPNEKNEMKHKPMSQPPICIAVGIPLAIRQALMSARRNADANAEAWVHIDGPTSVEWIYNNSLNDFKQYTL